MKAGIDRTSRATSSDQRKDSLKMTRASTLASTRTSSPSNAPMTIVSASRSSARRASGSNAPPPTDGSAWVFALGRAQSRSADTSPYRAASFAARSRLGSKATLLRLRMAFLPFSFLMAGPCFSAVGRRSARLRVAGKIIGIEAANFRNVRQKPIQMNAHLLSGAGAVAGFDCRRDGGVLADGPLHAALLRQCQPPVAIDMDFDLFDQRPNPAIAGGLGDGGMKGLVRLMEGVAIAGATRLTLALQVGKEGDDLAALGALGGEPGGCLFQRLANDNHLGQRGERYARYECARLREYLDQPFVGEFAQGFAHRRAAEAVDFRADPAGANAARPRLAHRRRLSRRKCAQRTCLDLITALPNADPN